MGKGTGLGLATVYGIVKQNGGSICVHSTPGKGTIFVIFFPRGGTTPKKAKEVEAVTAVEGEATVLVVEDEPQVLELTKTIFKTDGFNVLEAETPGYALHIAKTHEGHIDLLLTDVVMPELDGMALQALIKEIRPNIRTVFTSGYAEPDIPKSMFETQQISVRKPFSPADLTAKLREVLQSS